MSRSLVLALALTKGIGAKTVLRVLTRNDLLDRSDEEFLRLGEESLREEYRFNAPTAKRWVEERDERLGDAERLAHWMDSTGVRVITASDAHYPRILEEMLPEPPGVLFLYGNERLLESRTFCALSSRKSPPAALDHIEDLVEEGVLAGETLVTGHDTPEYRRGAVVPLRWGAARILALDEGMTSALGTSLDEEPFAAARLWRYKFDPKTDLVVSLVHPDRGYRPNLNRERDQLVAALSRRLDFVNIGQGGNMERLAKLALKDGRPVRVSEMSLGHRDLRQLGATILDWA